MPIPEMRLKPFRRLLLKCRTRARAIPEDRHGLNKRGRDLIQGQPASVAVAPSREKLLPPLRAYWRLGYVSVNALAHTTIFAPNRLASLA